MFYKGILREKYRKCPNGAGLLHTVNLSSMTSVVRIHHLPPVNKGTPFGVLLLFRPDKYMRYREKSNCFSGKTEGSMDIDAFIKHLNRKGLSYQEK